MQFSMVLVAAATLGIDYGWQPLDDGQLEYIIQIKPELLSAMQQGEDVFSELLPEVRGVRRIRVKIGNDPLPRLGSMPEIDDDSPADEAPDKPWFWLTAALVGLFVSLSANVYQGWIMLAIRRQYHKVVAEMVGRA